MGKLNLCGQHPGKITLWKAIIEQYQLDKIICLNIIRNTIGI